MSDLLAWLRVQLDEDERTAKAATPGPWTVDSETYAETIYGREDEAVVAGGRWGDEASVFNETEDAIHIARQNPARTLVEVESKRRILDGIADADPHSAYITSTFTAWDVLRLLALPYADRNGYRDEWRPA